MRTAGAKSIVLIGFMLAVAIGVVAGWAPLLPFLFPPLIFMAIRKRTLPAFLSPVWIAVGILWALGVIGWLTYPMLLGAAGGGLQVVLDADIADKTAILIGWSVTALTAGSAIGILLTREISHDVTLKPFEIAPRYRQVLLVASLVPVAMILADTPLDVLWSRPQYQMYVAVAPIAVLGHQMAVAAVPILGFLFAKEKAAGRLLIVFASVAYLTVFFSYGSRRLAMLPILFALGAYAGSMTKKALAWMVPAVVASAALLPVPLYVRGLSLHGLQPYLEALPNVFQDGPSWETTLNNIMVFFPITALTAYGTPTIPLDAIWLELNPLPGELVGWYNVASTLGLNRATPYSGLGEMGNAGWHYVAGVWITIGLMLSVLEHAVHTAMKLGQQVFAVAIVGMSGLFAFTVTQYNFRSAQRDLIYAFAVAVVVWMISMKARPTTDAVDPARRLATRNLVDRR